MTATHPVSSKPIKWDVTVVSDDLVLDVRLTDEFGGSRRKAEREALAYIHRSYPDRVFVLLDATRHF